MPSQSDKDRALAIVREHISWHRLGRPMPIGGFPAEYFADELVEEIAKAICEAREKR